MLDHARRVLDCAFHDMLARVVDGVLVRGGATPASGATPAGIVGPDFENYWSQVVKVALEELLYKQ